MIFFKTSNRCQFRVFENGELVFQFALQLAINVVSDMLKLIQCNPKEDV